MTRPNGSVPGTPDLTPNSEVRATTSSAASTPGQF